MSSNSSNMFSSAKILIILLVTVQLSSVSCLDEDQKNQAYDVVHKILGIYTDLSSALSFLPTVGPAFGILGGNTWIRFWVYTTSRRPTV